MVKYRISQLFINLSLLTNSRLQDETIQVPHWISFRNLPDEHSLAMTGTNSMHVSLQRIF